jgi:hypothetical protein
VTPPGLNENEVSHDACPTVDGLQGGLFIQSVTPRLGDRCLRVESSSTGPNRLLVITDYTIVDHGVHGDFPWLSWQQVQLDPCDLFPLIIDGIPSDAPRVVGE